MKLNGLFDPVVYLVLEQGRDMHTWGHSFVAKSRELCDSNLRCDMS